MGTAKQAATLTLERGEQVSGVIFKGARRPMTRGELQRAIAPVVAHWVKATCLWDERAALGDSRFVVFSIEVTPKVEVYVQLWSEPGLPVLWEVSSGKADPRAAKWLAGDRAGRIEALGFALPGDAENYQKEVVVSTPAEATRVARAVVDICYACFDYHGEQPLHAFAAFESRADPQLTYDGFTPEDLILLLDACGFTVDAVEESDEAPVIRATRRGIQTRLVCTDRTEDEAAFRTALLTAEVETTPEVARAAAAPVPADAQRAVLTVGTTLMFGGGVTADWVLERLREWDAMTWEAGQTARPRTTERLLRAKRPVH